jgi:hypothetical protein
MGLCAHEGATCHPSKAWARALACARGDRLAQFAVGIAATVRGRFLTLSRREGRAVHAA